MPVVVPEHVRVAGLTESGLSIDSDPNGRVGLLRSIFDSRLTPYGVLEDCVLGLTNGSADHEGRALEIKPGMTRRRRRHARGLPFIAMPTTGRSRSRPSSRSWTVLIALSLILALTLAPVSRSMPVPSCWWCGEFATADFILNVLLFVPLGLALGISGGIAIWAAIMIAILISGGVELAQLAIPGRYPTISDVLANTLGTLTAFLAVRRNRARGRITGRRADRAAVLWMILILGVVLGTRYLLGPSLPDSEWDGAWTPLLPAMPRFPGHVLAADLGGVPIPDGPVGESDSARRMLVTGLPVSVRFTTTGSVSGLAPVLRLEDVRDRGILLVGIRSPDLVVRLRRRSNDLRMHAPDAYFRDAAPGVSDTAVVRSALKDSRLCLMTSQGRSCTPLSTPGAGWSLLVRPPGSVPDWTRHLLDGLWLAGLFLPLGVFARLRPTRLVPVIGAVSVVVISALSGPLPVLVSSLVGTFSGLAAGRVASLRGRRIYAG